MTVRLRTEEGEYLFDSPREAVEYFRGLTPEAGAGTVALCTKEGCECEPGAHSHWETLFVLSSTEAGIPKSQVRAALEEGLDPDDPLAKEAIRVGLLNADLTRDWE